MSVGPVTVCISAFVGANYPALPNSWILGGGFLAHYYSIYDMGNNQIGFVTAA